MNEITCISPIDGKVFATRNTLSLKDAKDEIQRLRAAQSAWSARPLSERYLWLWRVWKPLEK